MKVIKNCPICKATFEVWPYRKNAKYCSVKCMSKGYCTSIEKTCKACKELFAIPNSKKDAKFCSHKCQGAYYKQYGSPTTTHGMSYTPEHRIWDGMKKRCSPTADERHLRDYYNRGIRVCDRWASSFSNFFEDMGKRPSPKHSIDRIDNDGNYEPSNCRWATTSQQMKNRRKFTHKK